jgi:hypothetical protein
LKFTVTPEMLAAHAAAFPPPAPLFADITVDLEEPTKTISVEIPESWLAHLRGLFPGLSDDRIVVEIVNDFLGRFGY